LHRTYHRVEIKTGRASEEVTYGITSLNRQRVGLEQAKPRKLWLLCAMVYSMRFGIVAGRMSLLPCATSKLRLSRRWLCLVLVFLEKALR